MAHNKILAKLGSGLHKPAQQTVVPLTAVAALLAPLPVGRLRQLGGKFGEQLMRDLGIATVGALQRQALLIPLYTIAYHGCVSWLARLWQSARLRSLQGSSRPLPARQLSRKKQTHVPNSCSSVWFRRAGAHAAGASGGGGGRGGCAVALAARAGHRLGGGAAVAGPICLAAGCP